MNTIKELGVKITKNIEQLQDFHVFTGYSYDRYKKSVNSGLKESVVNTRTNTNLDENEVADLLLKYLDNDLPKIVIYQLVSYFDEFQRELKKIDKNITIDVDDKKRVIEIRETRHVLAHNSGIVDKQYIKRSGDLARAQLGEILPLSRPYIYDSADFIRQVVRKLSA